VSLLVGGRRSPKGERAAVERVCGGALSRGPESVSGGARGPRPGQRQHRIRRTAGLTFGDFFLISCDPVLFDSNPNYFFLFMR
jgi:hypothetical protein